MVNEEDGPTVAARALRGAIPNAAFDNPALRRFVQMMQLSSRGALVNAPIIDRSKYGDLFKRVLAKLMDGQYFSDRNPDPDAAMVVDIFAAGLAKANPENKALADAVANRLPTSGFSPLLMKLQRMLGIKVDGVLGTQSYFALLTGGALNLNEPLEKVVQDRRAGRAAAEALMNSIGIRPIKFGQLPDTAAIEAEMLRKTEEMNKALQRARETLPMPRLY